MNLGKVHMLSVTDNREFWISLRENHQAFLCYAWAQYAKHFGLPLSGFILLALVNIFGQANGHNILCWLLS